MAGRFKLYQADSHLEGLLANTNKPIVLHNTRAPGLCSDVLWCFQGNDFEGRQSQNKDYGPICQGLAGFSTSSGLLHADPLRLASRGNQGVAQPPPTSMKRKMTLLLLYFEIYIPVYIIFLNEQGNYDIVCE